MGKRSASIHLFLLLALATAPARGAVEPLAEPPEIASYTLRAQLDPATHRIDGRGRIRWRNTTSHPAAELRFHLYLNAFAHSATTWLRREGKEQAEILQEGGWGWIEISALATAEGRDLLARLEHVSPDDGNPEDRTVARVPLPEAVPPGGSLELTVEFIAQLPRVVARTGFKDDFHLAAQWFPKLGVFEPDGTWSCHQFHRSSEFYADFGTYDVTLVVPREFVVGATGGRPVATEERGPQVAHRFVQGGVHDFAWTAWPGFVRRQRTVHLDGLPPVEVILLLPRENLHHAGRYFTALEHGLQLYGAWYGPYPYPALTMVAPPWGADGAGGMEYPTFITTGGSVLSPPATLRPETVTVHELGHQYFYGLVATDELTESYLDEGITTYATARVLRRAYGPRAFRVHLWEVPWGVPGLLEEHPLDTSAFYFLHPSGDPIARTSWGYLDRDSYRALTYHKTALLMEQVERTVGGEAMERAMRAYVETWRYRHPRTGDLVATLSRETGRDLGPLFRQTLTGSEVLDFAVTAAETGPRRGAVGTFGHGAQRRRVDEAAEEAGFESTVVVRRLGGVRLPVTTRLTFADGRSRDLRWDGRERWVRYRVRGPQLLHAEVDPEEVLVLDADRLNNSRRTAPDRRAARRWGQQLRFLIQNLLESFAALA